MVQENRLNPEKNRKIIVVCGPTASGKTALAVEIALKFGGEIVSADSVSVYKGLDIGSAKPSEEEKKGEERCHFYTFYLFSLSKILFFQINIIILHGIVK